MQIKNLPKNLYHFYAWARSQECLDAYRKKIEEPVRMWESLRAEGVSNDKCAIFTGISRATFYRYRASLQALLRGEVPPSKAPKKRNKPRWGEREKQLVLEIQNDTDSVYYAICGQCSIISACTATLSVFCKSG